MPWRTGDRILRTIRLQDRVEQVAVDLDALARSTVERWSTIADRTWDADATLRHSVRTSEERMRACLDTMIENAVRHTKPGDRIRVLTARVGASLCLGVADSGPGFTVAQAEAVNRGGFFERDLPPGAQAGQTGYGLGIIRELAQSHGGEVRIGRSREGGALVLVVLPTAA